MKSQWKRLLLAAMISSSVFAATWFWYQATDNKFSSQNNEKPVAYVGKIFDDIQRRPASRLLWQAIYNGEPLFNGEAIRTSDKGEVRIQFAGSDRYLDLEPESLIVIKQNQGEIALDLMEGSLFVNAKEGGSAEGGTGGGLVLNSATGKVDLSGASASLSKTKGRDLDLQVLEGKASIQDKNGQSRDLLKGSSGNLGANGVQFNQSALQILSPSPQKPVYMDAEDVKPVNFHWKGFPAEASVAVYLGANRKDLKQVAKTAKPGDTEVSARLPLGKHYWKLVALNAQGQPLGESPIYRAQVLARYAPLAIYPAANADVAIPPGAPFDLNFKWQSGEETRNITLEVWKDAALKQIVSTKSLGKEDSFTLPALPAGAYYWRVSGFFEDSDKPILGKVQKFVLTPSERLRDPASIKKNIEVVWAQEETNEPQLYFEKPQLDLKWKASTQPEVHSWKVTVHEENGSPVVAKNLPVTETNFKAPVGKPGRYLASIEALDKNGDVMGEARERTLTLAPAPLLTGPKFIGEEILKASNSGRADLQWEKIGGAKEYYLTISKDGKELKKAKYVINSTALKNLMPGEYQVQISAMDEHGRMSEPGESRKLLVPDSSGIKAPKLKKIKVN